MHSSNRAADATRSDDLDAGSRPVSQVQAIDWSLMAETQEDGYDTEWLKMLAKERYGWTKRYPDPGAVTWLEGTVTLRANGNGAHPGRENAPLDHPNIATAEALLRDIWPAMYRQCQELLQTVEPAITPDMPTDPLRLGCKCAPVGDRVSYEITTTIDGAVGMIEGIVHEFAHNKLKNLGISLEHWERLITNPQPTREAIDSGVGGFLYESPVRRDKLRPLGACLSSHYSFVYVCEWLLRLVRSDIVEITDCAGALRAMRWRLEEGETLVYEVAEFDAAGTIFFASLHDWADRLIAEIDRLVLP